MLTGLARGRQLGVNIPRSVSPGLWGGYSEVLFVPPEAIVHRLPVDLAWNAAALIEPLGPTPGVGHQMNRCRRPRRQELGEPASMRPQPT